MHSSGLNCTPVWRCQDVECGQQWVTWEAVARCPFCSGIPVERTGFTYGDVAEAAEKFGFRGDLPVHVPVPVPDLVQLSTLPQDTWIGLPVFHPMEQQGILANWLLYDTGIVLEVYPDPDFPGELQCRFVVSLGGHATTLHYQPDNLWVPSTLAKRILARTE